VNEHEARISGRFIFDSGGASGIFQRPVQGPTLKRRKRAQTPRSVPSTSTLDTIRALRLTSPNFDFDVP